VDRKIFFRPTPPRLSPGHYTSFDLPEIELICMKSHKRELVWTFTLSIKLSNCRERAQTNKKQTKQKPQNAKHTKNNQTNKTAQNKTKTGEKDSNVLLR